MKKNVPQVTQFDTYMQKSAYLREAPGGL